MTTSGVTADNDDWETDPDFINDVSEVEQRWGSKTIEGSGRDAGGIIEYEHSISFTRLCSIELR